MKQYYVYILSSFRRTLYIGMTNDLQRRVCEHKQKLVPGFTSQYNVDRLGYSETFNDVRDAIARETQLKKWVRHKKEALVEAQNPTWEDLSQHWELPNKMPRLRCPAQRAPALGMTSAENAASQTK